MNAKFSETIQYFKTLAAQHILIGHSLSEKHFYRLELEEILTGIGEVNYPALILEGYRYHLLDKQSDNVLKERSGAFVLLDHLHDRGDFDKMHEIWDNLESICDDIIVRIKADKRNPAITQVRDFDVNSIQVSLIANEHDLNYGIRCSFTLVSSLSTDVDPDRWNLDVDVPE